MAHPPGHGDIHRQVARYYSSKLEQHGTTAQGVDWRDGESQTLRHRQFLYLLGTDFAAEIADMGCGYGDFLRFVRTQNFTGPYIGYDVSAEMLEAARRLHGEGPDRMWRVGSPGPQAADYVVASGIFNVRMEISPADWQDYILDTIDVMARASRRGFAFNMLTTHVDYTRPDLHYGDPTRLFELCVQRYGRRVAVLQDYGLFEFTLCVRHAPAEAVHSSSRTASPNPDAP